MEVIAIVIGTLYLFNKYLGKTASLAISTVDVSLVDIKAEKLTAISKTTDLAKIKEANKLYAELAKEI